MTCLEKNDLSTIMKSKYYHKKAVVCVIFNLELHVIRPFHSDIVNKYYTTVNVISIHVKLLEFEEFLK